MSRLVAVLACSLVAAASGAKGQSLEEPEAPREASYSVSPGGMLVDRGPGELPLIVPRQETLEFEVLIDIALIGETRIGRFVLESGIDPFLPQLPLPGEETPQAGEAAWIRGTASGHYLGYRLKHEIEARILPQAWPRVIYRETKVGSEHRRRELKYGREEGVSSVWYRGDTHCRGCQRREHFVEGGLFSSEHHCERCKRAEHRIWNQPRTREIPDDAVDMLSALLLARTMVREELDGISFPLLEKDELWDVTLDRAEQRWIRVPAGEFLCRSIKLTPTPRNPEDENETFKGLFGIHGTLSIWIQEPTGVPIKIEGIVPVGAFDIGIALRLRSFGGTPPAFRPRG